MRKKCNRSVLFHIFARKCVYESISMGTGLYVLKKYAKRLDSTLN